MKQKESELVQHYELGRLLGQGTYAKVYFARNRRTGLSVAIKVIDKEKVLKAGMVDQIKREISVMRLAHHPNIVELYEVMASKKKIYFVMEYAKGGELFAKVAKGKLKEDETRKYFQQLISAIDYCHSRGVFHRDLKPENLLLDENGNLKVTDFGLSALAECKRHDGLLHTICGTPAYVAPDVINKKGYDGSKADIWSCGVILYVLLAGYLPFRDLNLIELYKKISKGEFKFPNWFAPEIQSLLSKILDPNPSSRMSISEIMESSWFQKGLSTNYVYTELQREESVPLDFDGVSGLHKNGSSTIGLDQEVTKPCSLNAFDIISYSAGLDLSGLFEDTHHKKELRFTSNKPAPLIISKLEDIAKHLGLKIQKKERGLLKLGGPMEGTKGALAIDAEIFEITPSFHVVEIRNSKGDTLEYQNILKQELRPALKDIIWSWQGEQPQQLQDQLNQQDLQHELLFSTTFICCP